LSAHHRARLLLTASLLVLAAALPALAHHAVQAQFDVSRTDTFTGKLYKVELINPHPYLYFEVGAGEALVKWEIEAPALIALRRVGLLKRLKVGDVYSVTYAPARNGTPLGLIRSITMPDGQTIVTSSADDPTRP
jgi:hypothetical protein